MGKRRHLSCDFRRIRNAGRDHDLMARIELQRRGQKQWQPFLPGDPAVEEGVRPAGVDAKASEGLRRLLRPVDLGIDSVVNDMNTLWFDCRIAIENILANPSRDRDHRVSAFHPGSLAEHLQGITAAELLSLPRSQRLEAVDRLDVWDRPHEFGQMTAEVRVPGMAVNEIDTLDR